MVLLFWQHTNLTMDISTSATSAAAMTTLDHTPLGHAYRYTEECYAGMRDDKARTEAYLRAIAQVASGRVVLDIGTGALALLALEAARAGATHVYALEVNEWAAEEARRNIDAAGYSSLITVICSFSTDASLRLPSKVSLLVHELIGEIAGEEGVCAAIHDARRRFLEPSAPTPLSIPARSRTLVAPCGPLQKSLNSFPPCTIHSRPRSTRLWRAVFVASPNRGT